MKTIGDRIRQAREARGWSAYELAMRVGYAHQSGISNLENRATGSGGNKIAAIAEALGVPVDWLLNGPDDATVPSRFVVRKPDVIYKTGLETAIAVLASHLLDMDTTTRRKTMALIADLETDPSTHAQTASAINALISSANRAAA